MGDTPSSADGGEGTAETEATADAEDTKDPEDTEDGVTDAPEADATDKSVDESADNSGIVEK
ncbi:Probable prolipoprotein diacylglyceryl transferase [Mycobacteroides abscessus]|nr:Probable prolipoprotein diacylglyceryl transferase [Mycobacteroides abscessus]CQA12599.1 Probable prolipoprotein diacylglyceryl transferase [Mycobacteroides abscessus]CQA12846.1 Probable prolipoprotein diacylglyceryl transferase [Mycobacteroides abscessus]